MIIKAFVGLGYQVLVEPLLRHSAFVRSYKNDCFPLGIKRKGYPPNSAIGIESEFLHICMLRPAQGIGIRPSQRWAMDFKQASGDQQFKLNRTGQSLELRIKSVMVSYRPCHTAS